MDLLSSCFLVPGFSRSECASWVQAWGSVIAIFVSARVAMRVVDRSNTLERQRASEVEERRKKALHEAAFQLVGGAHQIFDKVWRLSAKPAAGDHEHLGVLLIELRGVIGTLERVDVVVFDTYAAIEGIIRARNAAVRLAEAIEKVLPSTVIGNSAFPLRLASWSSINQEAKGAMDDIRPKLDEIRHLISS